MKTLSKVSKLAAVRGLPVLTYQNDVKCSPCQQGKQIRAPHSAISDVTTSHNLELLHMDLMGPVNTPSITGKKYIFVCVDDFSRYTWVDFLSDKSEAVDIIIKLVTQLQTEKASQNLKVVRMRSDHGREFENSRLANFCEVCGIKQEFSAAITPSRMEL